MKLKNCLFIILLMLCSGLASGQSKTLDSIAYKDIMVKGLPYTDKLLKFELKLGLPDSTLAFVEVIKCYTPDTLFYYIKGYQFNKIMALNQVRFMAVDLTKPHTEISLKGLKVSNLTTFDDIKARFPLSAKTALKDNPDDYSPYLSLILKIANSTDVIRIDFKNRIAVRVAVVKACE